MINCDQLMLIKVLEEREKRKEKKMELRGEERRNPNQHLMVLAMTQI